METRPKDIVTNETLMYPGNFFFMAILGRTITKFFSDCAVDLEKYSP
jgi:hypothetical protein